MHRRTFLGAVCSGAGGLQGCLSIDLSETYHVYLANTDDLGHVVDIEISGLGDTLWEKRRWLSASDYSRYDDVFSMRTDDDWTFEVAVAVDNEEIATGFYPTTIDTFGIVVQGPSTVGFAGSERTETPRPSPTRTVDEGSPTATSDGSQ